MTLCLTHCTTTTISIPFYHHLLPADAWVGFTLVVGLIIFLRILPQFPLHTCHYTAYRTHTGSCARAHATAFLLRLLHFSAAVTLLPRARYARHCRFAHCMLHLLGWVCTRRMLRACCTCTAAAACCAPALRRRSYTAPFHTSSHLRAFYGIPVFTPCPLLLPAPSARTFAFLVPTLYAALYRVLDCTLLPPLRFTCAGQVYLPPPPWRACGLVPAHFHPSRYACAVIHTPILPAFL